MSAFVGSHVRQLSLHFSSHLDLSDEGTYPVVHLVHVVALEHTLQLVKQVKQRVMLSSSACG